MFKSSRNSLHCCLKQIRSIHTLPKLPNHEIWSKEGIKGLLSPEGYNLAWTDYQTYLLTKLTLLTNGTANETKTPYEILLNTAKQTTQQHTFHYASMSHMNHFFFQQLIDKPTEDSTTKTKPSRFLMEKLMNIDILDLNQLRNKILTMAENSNGQGWIYLIEDKNKNLSFLQSFNDGIPFYFGKRQQFDLNGGIDELTFNGLNKLEKRAQKKAGQQLKDNDDDEKYLPILAINYWDYMYIKDYGITGKSEYLNNLWDNLNWDVINKRLFQI
ncbi:uncharacterized protein KGF55_000082 [Candida pseudojiufengensis]|uniref:uncharacterized protein n=1 Tax=Candida pseudojiufengensis TaxID=497109 RepID=UPI0022251F91|nr:uncharacterized protein KGF55_000082 [Candida pseudojiufengensis]KAI5967811.1 hypothetical protein KGF55_000082 [Candida pseudojiufengensis]